MKRLIILISSIILICSSTNASAANLSIEINTCSKINSVSTISGFKHTCIASGNKLIWSKDVIDSKSVKSTPTNFEDIWKYRSGIASASWSKTNKIITKNKAKLPPLEIYRGPSTPLYYKSKKDLVKVLSEVTRMYPNAILPSKIVIFYYTRPEMSWGELKAKEIMGADYQRAYDAHGGPMIKCNVVNDCDDGDAFVGENDVAYIAIGVPLNPNQQVKYHSATMQGEIVEFYHSLQEMYYKKNNSYQKNVGGIAPPNRPPHWLSVGGENLTSTLIVNKSDFTTYKKQATSFSFFAKNIGIDFSDASLNNYLDIANLGNYWSDNRAAKGKIDVIMGQYLVTIMVALKGPSVMLEFHKQMSAGITYEDAFKNIFGASWASAQPKLVRVIKDEYKNGY